MIVTMQEEERRFCAITPAFESVQVVQPSAGRCSLSSIGVSAPQSKRPVVVKDKDRIRGTSVPNS